MLFVGAGWAAGSRAHLLRSSGRIIFARLTLARRKQQNVKLKSNTSHDCACDVPLRNGNSGPKLSRSALHLVDIALTYSSTPFPIMTMMKGSPVVL
jgi:hypothetical protein